MRYFNEKNLLEFDPNSSKSDIQEGLKVTGNGKGDGRRPGLTSSQQLAVNWCRTFGHKRIDPETNSCRDCGELQAPPAQIIDLMQALKDSLAKK